jgi:hypothetical protein
MILSFRPIPGSEAAEAQALQIIDSMNPLDAQLELGNVMRKRSPLSPRPI